MPRNRSFDPEEALEIIKDVFWEYGYEGASIQDIEAATGLKKQSLYRLFGDKRGMYLAAIRHYDRHEVQEVNALLFQRGAARTRFERVFNCIIDLAIKNGDRRGCFLCNASVDQAQLDGETQGAVSKIMDQMRRNFEEALLVSDDYKSARIREPKAAELMAAYFGLRVLIKANMPEAFLRKAAKSAVRTI